MNEEDQTAVEGEAETKPSRPRPKYDADPNVQARKRAGKRSSNRNSGKPVEEGIAEEAPVSAEAPAVPEAEGEEGGIVAAAEQEVETVQEAKEEAAEGEAPEMEAAEAPEMEAAEETAEPAAEEAAAAEEMAEEAPAEEAPAEEAPAMETAEEAPAEMPEPMGEYQAPEGQSHEELIDAYHEALTFGDKETANQLYKQLQDHRYHENKFRGKSEAQAEAEAAAYLALTKKIAAAHPELGVDGIEADKVLALTDVYRNTGKTAAEALQMAVADLYPETPAALEMVAPEMAVAEEPATEMPEETPEPPAAETAPKEEPEPLIPDMSDRMLQKRSIPAMPGASARSETPPPPKPKGRGDAIEEMKKARGQA